MIISKNILFGIIIILVIGAFGSFVISQQSPIEATVCCEQTNAGAFCQNVPAAECAAGARQVPTSCGATSYCRSGTCYDSSEGICMDNTPQLVCNQAGGVWNAEKPAQCNLGCCILGDQAAFVSLVRCKKLSATLGLKTNYDTSTTNEVACIAKVQQQEKGACVYEFEFEKTCKFTTRAECSGSTQAGVNGTSGTTSAGNFYGGKLCSAEELGTNCGLSTKTACVPGKDEVYFVDTCGNPANIYDASKVNNKDYWTDVKTKDQSCAPGQANAGSASCGNCNYLEGSICRSENLAGKNPTYGDFICADLNCKNTQNGNDYKHGESWCVYNDAGRTGNSDNTVGSRFYKHICINGQETLEQCEDFRAEECIEEKVNDFSQAACKVNRWQDCTSQTDSLDCENEDKRDCVWKPELNLKINETDDDNDGACFPENKPGFNFWSDTETQTICSQGDDLCIVTFEEGLFGGEDCEENCECLTDDWEKLKVDACTSLGDCGPSLNWIGARGYKSGYNITFEDVD